MELQWPVLIDNNILITGTIITLFNLEYLSRLNLLERTIGSYMVCLWDYPTTMELTRTMDGVTTLAMAAQISITLEYVHFFANAHSNCF